MIRTVDVAKALMRSAEVVPTFDSDNVGELSEVFGHPAFRDADAAKRRDIMTKSSTCKYQNEFQFPFDKYFGFELQPELQGKTVLDLGCFTGGRSVAWLERYGLKRIAGTDVNPVFIEAGNQFAAQKQVDAEFRLGSGENLPYSDNCFDAVLSFDVLEHVRDIKATLEECHRVLKPGGKFFLVFPTYFQPLEHHLGLVTKLPGLQFLFSGKTLVRAYFEIIDERGADGRWYRREAPDLWPHERGHTINGTSFRQFRKVVGDGRWDVEFVCRKPIGSIGRTVDKSRLIKALSVLFVPLVYIPYLQEVFLHRVTMIIRKRG